MKPLKGMTPKVQDPGRRCRGRSHGASISETVGTAPSSIQEVSIVPGIPPFQLSHFRGRYYELEWRGTS